MAWSRIIIGSLLVLDLIIYLGCATPGTSSMLYKPPIAQTVQNEVTIGKPFDVVWDELVRGLSKSYFVINNIEKSSRIINLSFSTDDPPPYVDCGTTHRTFERYEKKEIYDYPIAGASSYKLAVPHSLPTTASMSRKTSLDGRINIYVAPGGNDSTTIMVNTKYILTISATGTVVMESLSGAPILQEQVPPQPKLVNFNTNQPNETNLGTAEEQMMVSCQSTGKIEKDILDLIKVQLGNLE